jgi:hypothetical protein
MEEQAQYHWLRPMIYQELDQAFIWTHSRLTSMWGASAFTFDLLVARISTKAVVVVSVVGLNSTEPATDHSLVGVQDLVNMAHEVRSRAESDVARMTEDFRDHGAAGGRRVGPVGVARRKGAKEMDLSTWA